MKRKFTPVKRPVLIGLGVLVVVLLAVAVYAQFVRAKAPASVQHKGAFSSAVGKYNFDPPTGWAQNTATENDGEVATFTSANGFEIKITSFAERGTYGYDHNLLAAKSLTCPPASQTTGNCSVQLVGAPFWPADDIKANLANVMDAGGQNTLTLVRYPGGSENVGSIHRKDGVAVYTQGRFVGEAATQNVATNSQEFLNTIDVILARKALASFKY